MNKDELRQWEDAVLEHCKMKTTIISDRRDIEDLMKSHLSQYFDWDKIEFDENFDTIKLYWRYGSEPLIKIREIRDLGMDFFMNNEYDDVLGQCNTIIIYPFGVPKEGKVVEW